MYEIRKQFEFSAAHQLHGLPVGHPCGREHGHNYIVEIVLQSETLDEHGFVVDYGALSELRAFIDEYLEHRSLNDVLEQPSAEHLAKFLHERALRIWPQTVAVRVSETPKTWAEYRPVESVEAIIERLLKTDMNVVDRLRRALRMD